MMIARLLVAACLLAGVGPWNSASAAFYAFVGGGFPGGLTNSVTITGSDLNGDGYITSADDEVTRFTLTFAPLAAAFPGFGDTIDYSPPPAGNPPSVGLTFLLRYRADGGPLGDDLDEFVTYAALILVSYSLDGGLDSCVAQVACAFWAIIDAANGATVPDYYESAEILRPLPAAVVPAPGAAGLLATALLGLAGLVRPGRRAGAGQAPSAIGCG